LATPRHLTNAPITEAVIDFMIEPTPEKNFSQLESAYRNLDFGYRQQGAVVAGAFQVTTSQEGIGVQAFPGGDPRIGLRLASSDDKYVALVRLNGLAVSRLTPYENFEALSLEMRRLWNIYINRWAPEKIRRVACRFINNLRLPMAIGQSFGEFVTTFTEVPPNLPQGLSNFVQQFNLQGAEATAVRVSLAWDGTWQKTDSTLIVPMIFDIDAFKLVDIDVHDEVSWELLEKLRELKNQCFFGALTEACVKNYE
jgi:uncharacterized protein (TIGR04255 family)